MSQAELAEQGGKMALDLSGRGAVGVQVGAVRVADAGAFDIEEPDYVWAAAFGVTADGLPMIGRVPGFRNVHAAMGYGGNGITFSQIAAEIIAAGILGHDDADATLFSFR